MADFAKIYSKRVTEIIDGIAQDAVDHGMAAENRGALTGLLWYLSGYSQEYGRWEHAASEPADEASDG